MINTRALIDMKLPIFVTSLVGWITIGRTCAEPTSLSPSGTVKDRAPLVDGSDAVAREPTAASDVTGVKPRSIMTLLFWLRVTCSLAAADVTGATGCSDMFVSEKRDAGFGFVVTGSWF